MSGRHGAPPSAPTRDAQAAGAQASDVHFAAVAARAFVEGYVRHREGRLAAARTRGAAPALRQALHLDTARPSWPVRRRQARIAELHTQLDGPHARACARVTDSHAAVVRVTVSLERRDGAWEVVDVSER
jgi:hypothetical protein